MKHCPECGFDLSKVNQVELKPKTKTDSKKRYRVTTGILTIITSSLTVILLVAATMSALSQHNYDYYGYNNSYEINQIKVSIYSIIAVFSAFAFFSGLFGGILILFKRFYSFAIMSIAFLIVVALLSIGLHILTFLFLGIPILVLSILSSITLNLAKKDFIS